MTRTQYSNDNRVIVVSSVQVLHCLCNTVSLSSMSFNLMWCWCKTLIYNVDVMEIRMIMKNQSIWWKTCQWMKNVDMHLYDTTNMHHVSPATLLLLRPLVWGCIHFLSLWNTHIHVHTHTKRGRKGERETHTQAYTHTHTHTHTHTYTHTYIHTQTHTHTPAHTHPHTHTHTTHTHIHNTLTHTQHGHTHTKRAMSALPPCSHRGHLCLAACKPYTSWSPRLYLAMAERCHDQLTDFDVTPAHKATRAGVARDEQRPQITAP